jgi:hypothetical protein
VELSAFQFVSISTSFIGCCYGTLGTGCDHGHGGERVVGGEHLAILQVTFAIGAGDLGAETPQRIRGGAFHAH